MTQATFVNSVTSTVFGFWWVRQGDGSDVQLPYMQSEVIPRKGLGNAIRRIGYLPGDRFQVWGKTDLPTRQDAESMMVALHTAQSNFHPLAFNQKRRDNSWLNYDTLGIRFVIISDGSPGILFNTRDVQKVVGGYFTNSKVIVDLQLTLLPVAI